MKTVFLLLLFLYSSTIWSQNKLYDSSRSLLENVNDGYIDTFSINEQQFRIYLDTAATNDDFYILEKFRENHWVKNTGLGDLGKWGYSRSTDINDDGFPDIQIIYRYYSYFYLYNSTAGRFNDTKLSFSTCGIIDKSNKIFYSNNHFDQNSFSDLFTFKNLVPYYFYHLTYIHDKYHDRISKIILFKCHDGKKYRADKSFGIYSKD